MAIYCLVGKTGSGKDTIRKEILRCTDICHLVMCTTRPPRDGEVDGVDYFFRTYEEMKKDFRSGKMICSKSYNTVHGEWCYYLMLDKGVDYSKGNYLTDGSVLYMDLLLDIAMSLGVDVFTIYLDVEDKVRVQRLVDRESSGKGDFSEMCRRFLSDDADFSHYKNYPYDLRVSNSGMLADTMGGIISFLSDKSVVIRPVYHPWILDDFFREE